MPVFSYYLDIVFLPTLLEDSDLCGLDADAAQRLRALQVLQGATGSGRVEVDLQSDWKFFEVRNFEPGY